MEKYQCKDCVYFKETSTLCKQGKISYVGKWAQIEANKYCYSFKKKCVKKSRSMATTYMAVFL